ncbi:hypothetical protein HFN16_02680 [Pseudodesulfovibrio sp. zrk46]|nr:hypothetical protein HFN16_02680 [Pseudodesulfovibrio sp. zrk46]
MKIRYVIITTLVLLLLMATSAMSIAGGAFAGDRVPRMTTSQLAGMLDSPDVVVIDVRRDTDFQGSEMMIKGAQRRAYNDVDGWAGELSKEKTLVLYCA